ncbi:MAG: outer membrane beta-barrel protein, partial [Bacteroidota bacterium]
HKADHTHQADLKINHAFTEIYKLDVSDSFVVAQEPDLIDKGGPISRPLRTEGSNLRNTASANFTAGLTEKLSTVLGYSNTIYDYEQSGLGSLSSLLDRTEHMGTINLRWQALPSTIGIAGYQYGVTSYDSKNVLAIRANFTPGGIVFRDIHSDIRDSTSHYVYTGVDHSFTPQLNSSLRLGAQFTQYDNIDEDTASPYVDGSATWTYNPGSYVQLGVRHQRQATDIAFFNVDTPTLDQEASTVYLQLNHKITAKLTGSLLGQFQNASFNAGS